MYRPLTGIPGRALLDTMLLLNGAFIRDGVARRAINALSEMGYSACCDDTSWSDAIRILGARRIALGLSYDPIPTLISYARDSNIVHLPPSPVDQTAIVNRADQHLANAARDRIAWVLTEDAPLIKQLISVNIEVRSTWDVLYASLEGETPPLEFPIRVTRMSRTNGYLFGRIFTGSWAGRRHEGQFTICEVENVGRLYYDNGLGRWIIEMQNNLVVWADCDVGTNETWAVCASYRLPTTSGQNGNVTLRAAGPDGQRVANSRSTLRALPPHHIGRRSSFGSSLDGSTSLDGHIQAIVLGRRPISGVLWRAISSVPEGAPNPFGSDVLDDALLATSFTTSGIANLPSQSELV